MSGTRGQRLVDVVRHAPWMTADRAMAYCRVLAVVTAAALLVWIGLSHGLVDVAGQPIGTDFSSFWTASKLTLAGAPDLAYDAAAHAAAEGAAFPDAEPGYFAFFYPPIFLLICWPFALLPYGPALAAWLGVTGLAYGRVIARLGGDRLPVLPILAFPGVLVTLGHGQNAFLSTALFGGAILARGRPVLAGLLFGALAYKPHLGLMIPVFVAASGAWTTALAATNMVLALAAVSTFAFGPDIWAAFWASTPLARQALTSNLVGAEKMQSVFAAVQLWHGPLWLGYAAQGAAAVLAAAVLIHVVRRRSATGAGGPVLVVATLLASPFLLDYDLTLLAVPLAWVFARAARTGFLPWEKITLMAGFALPLVSRTVALHLGLPLCPIVTTALLLVLLRRARMESVPCEVDPASAPACLAWAG